MGSAMVVYRDILSFLKTTLFLIVEETNHILYVQCYNIFWCLILGYLDLYLSPTKIPVTFYKGDGLLKKENEISELLQFMPNE